MWVSMTLAALIILSSCEGEATYDRSTGKINEILVVTNTKDQWNGKVGATVRRFFQEPLAGLPQPEPMFRLFNVTHSDLNQTFRALHNILVIDISSKYDKALVETRKNQWSKPQRVIRILAPDTASFFKAFNEHKGAFLKAYNELEIERTNAQFKMARSVKLMNIVEKKFGFSMQIPGGFVVGANDNNFLWLRQSMQKVKQDVELGILIHERPYTDTSAFAQNEILILRDSLTSKFVSGPSVGSFMITSREFIPPAFTRMDDFVTGFAVETRGLWMVQNDFMGGPFISYTFVDPSLERVITVDGYVYNPGDLKRNFIRQMEAIFHTISFGNQS
jgi:hypothetical protein